METMAVDKNEALSLLKKVICCNTVNPPGNETILARQLQQLLVDEGIRAEVSEFSPQRANLLAYIPGKEHQEKLMLTGHLDTVPAGASKWQHDPFGAEIEEGMLYGRGAADMKGSVAAMLYAMILLQRAKVVPPQDIVFLGTAGEETKCLGAENFVKNKAMDDIKAVLVGEPSNGEMLVAHKGAIWAKIKTYGRTAHGSMPDLGINAINLMTKFITKLNEQQFECSPDPWLGMPSFSVNTVSGGVATNVVPDMCSCTVDIRTVPGQTEKQIREFLEKTLEQAGAGETNFRHEYELLIKEEPVKCPENHPILDALDAAAGKKLRRRGVTYYTDASVLVGTSGLPMVIYGPGDDKQAHQPDEHIVLAKYYEAIEVYYRFMKNYKI